MNTEYPKREIELVKRSKARQALLDTLHFRRVELQGQEEAVRMVLGDGSPVPKWLADARRALSDAIRALEVL